MGDTDISIFYVQTIDNTIKTIDGFAKTNAANRPDFMLTLGFYHCFSITSLKKISCKIFAMLWKTQRIIIIEHYLYSHYWTKMSDTFTFNRTELAGVCVYHSEIIDWKSDWVINWSRDWVIKVIKRISEWLKDEWVNEGK